VCLFCISLTGFAQEMKRKDVSLTVYNQNFALVRDVRSINLKAGTNEIRFFDIAARIEPTSVHFKSITAPDRCGILEQNFEYDLVSADKLLLKYIDKVISVITQDDMKYTGYLASYDGGQIVLAEDKEKGPIFMINRTNVRNIEFPQLPEGLITRPTLVWSLLNSKAGTHDVEVSYITGGINWVADYVAAVSDDEKNISLTGWVTIDNKSGTNYEDASLKLVAGDVFRVQKREGIASDVMMKAMGTAVPQQFEERQLFEYHLYELQRKTTLKNNQTKQISLLTAPKVSVNKVYTYNGALYNWYYYDNWQGQQCNKKVAVNLEFKNSKENGLGIPLPKGTIKVYKADIDKSLQFIGENQIDHTPKDEKISLYLGNAFDIVGERKITDHKKLAANLYRDSYEITLRNHKKEPVVVKVIERQWGDWQVIQASYDYKKEDATTLVFEVKVPSNGETKVTYTSEYRF
ncbi:MAG: DUF4139 domain-containing protein, partial [Candidatus Ratteibacteria bacterium]|nr:DUF4139 domain-containing protein [Candidatus Ratteibacteria bacterium]